LFIRNVSFDTSEDQLRQVFGRFGEIKSCFSLTEKRGIFFLTFVRFSLPSIYFTHK
jgi:RNA recognition motif-containing protein